MTHLYDIQMSRHLFVPAERRIPKIRIETKQADSFENQRIVVVIDGWPRHSRYPQVRSSVTLLYLFGCLFFLDFIRLSLKL